MFVFNGNWTGHEENERIVVEADSQVEALELLEERFPGFHQVQCLQVYDAILTRQM